jgi:DNA-binding CsgD family transcriptional regulator
MQAPDAEEISAHRNKLSPSGLGFSIEAFGRRIAVGVFRGKSCRSRLSGSGAQPRIVLAPKEREVIRMVANGVSPRVIAQRLGLGESKLRASLDSVFAKLAMSGRLDLLSRRKAKDHHRTFAWIGKARPHRRFSLPPEVRHPRREHDKQIARP